MKVLLFCGGKGTRLGKENDGRPKPMVEIGGKPLLWHIMSRYARYGFKEFILPLGYQGSFIRHYFYNYTLQHADFTVDLMSGAVTAHKPGPDADWKITLCDTGENTGKGGRIKRVAAYLGDGPFMATYGDGVADIDLHALAAFHASHGRLATFTGVRMPSRFGTVTVNADGSVSTWREKPVLEQFINCGFFVFNPELLEYLTEDEQCDLEKGPLERLAGEGELMMYRHDGFWQCMDTPADYQMLRDMWQAGDAPWLSF